MIIRLNKDEVDQIISNGRAVYNNKKKYGVDSKKIDKTRTAEELDIIGFGGEYVVCKYLGIPYHFQLFKVKDDDYDLLINGKKIEIKVGKPEHKQLMIPQWQLGKRNDYYVLVKMYKYDVWDVVGYISKQDFLENMTVKRFRGYEDKPMYVVDSDKLIPLKIRS